MEVQPPPAPGQNVQQQQQQPPPLLRCLSQLNDDVLAACLLPKLVEQGSAAAVALTCTQLRALCQRSTQHLRLSEQLADADNPCLSPDVARQLVAAFPNCRSLDCAWHSSSIGAVYRSIGPLLAGLAQLSTISIRLDGVSKDGDLDPVLAQMHMHATALRCLRLQLTTRRVADMTWACVEKLVNLTRLEVCVNVANRFEKVVPFTQSHLRRLTGLSNLQSLTVEAPGAAWEQADCEDAALQLAVQEFPGRLTALTALLLPLGATHDISSVSACVRLRDLQVLVQDSHNTPRLHPEGWREQEWAALQRLSSLTRLHIDLEFPFTASADSYHDVLMSLKGLRVAGACCWLAERMPPLLHSSTHLTALYGSWEMSRWADVSRLGLVCPHIRELRGLDYGAPFEAFPNLTSVSFTCATHALSRCILDLSRHCTRLQRLAFTNKGDFMDHRDPVQSDSAAYKALAQLQHLTHLDLIPNTDAELVAFTSAAAAVRNPRLRRLHVQGCVTLFALMGLLSVRGLGELSVHAYDHECYHIEETFNEEALRTWLVGLAAVPKVSLVVHTEYERDDAEAAVQWAVRHELPLPAVLKVSGGR